MLALARRELKKIPTECLEVAIPKTDQIVFQVLGAAGPSSDLLI